MAPLSIHQIHQLGLSEPQVEIPDGDAKKGAVVFKKKCASCHTTNEGGSTKGGPNLHLLFGRAAGTVANFQADTAGFDSAKEEGFMGKLKSVKKVVWEGRWYSEANQESGIVWSDKHMWSYLEDPRKYIPGTKMVHGGIKNEKERANLIEYLRCACGATAEGYGAPVL